MERERVCVSAVKRRERERERIRERGFLWVRLRLRRKLQSDSNTVGSVAFIREAPEPRDRAAPQEGGRMEGKI